MTKQELIAVLKVTVTYYPQVRQHKLGYFDLSNKELRHICSTKLGNEFDDLSKRDKIKFIDEMFIILRGENDERS